MKGKRSKRSKRSKRLFKQNQADWQNDNTSDFQPLSPPDSPTLSSGYESVITEDLDLYDARLGLGVALATSQISLLDEHFDDFRASEYEIREKYVRHFAREFLPRSPGLKNKEKESTKVIEKRRNIETLIRQHLYGKIKPVREDSAPGTRTVEESEEIELTDEHIRMLEKCVIKFRAANPTRREKMVQDAAETIQRTRMVDVEFNRVALINFIREYLHRKIKRRAKKPAFEIRKWTYLEVFTAMNGEKIDKLAARLSQSKAGSPGYLAGYHRARRQLEEKLTEDERQTYRATAKEWSRGKLPPMMQQRMLKKHGAQAIREFTSLAYNQMGMRVLVLGAYVDSEGLPAMGLYDFTDENGGMSFKASYEDWKEYKMLRDFSRWGAEFFRGSLTDSSDSEGESHGRKKKSPEVKLKRNKEGYPILPSLEEMDRHGLLYKKQVIGKFMAAVYEISAGAKNGRVPWCKLNKGGKKYIKSKYLPKNIELKQYYHLVLEDVNAMLGHWTQRQAVGKVPLKFRKAVNAGDNMSTTEDNDTDFESGEEEEEDDSSTDDGDTDAETWSGFAGEDLQDDAAENPSRSSPYAPDICQGTVQPSAAADMHNLQQTGGGIAPDLPHTRCLRTRSRRGPPNFALADGSRVGQTDGAPSDGGQSVSGSAEQEPSPNDETQSAAHERQQSQLGSPGAPDEDQRPPPGSPNAAELPCGSPNAAEPPHSSPNAAEPPHSSPNAAEPPHSSPNAAEPPHGPPNAAEPPPGSPNAADEDQRPPPASLSAANERQRSPPALPGAASLETQGGGRRRRRENGGAAADPPSSKRRKVDHQVDSAGSNTRRSKRDRRPTTKAAEA